MSKAIVKKLYFSVIVFTVTVVEFIKWLTDRFVMLNQFVFCLKGKRLLIPYRNKWCLGNTFDVGVIFVYKRLGVFTCNFKYCRSFLVDFGFRYSGFFERGTTS